MKVDLTKLLEQLGSNFVKSAFMPSLFFVIAIFFMFIEPLIKITIDIKTQQDFYTLLTIGVLFIIFTIIVGYTLTALRSVIINIFEGYSVLFPFRALYVSNWKKHKRIARSMQLHILGLKRRIRHLEERASNSKQVQQELEEMKDRYYYIVAYYNLHYPGYLEDVLPTQLGNIIKATENYTGEIYGFDSFHFLPRLLQLIPTDSRLAIDDVRNELSLHLNLSFLSLVFSYMCIFAFFFTLTTIRVINGDQELFFQFLYTTVKYCIGVVLGFTISAIFYRTSVRSAGELSLVLRSTSDLFRLELLKKLGVKRPKDSDEEIEIWIRLNERFVLGKNSLTFEKIIYSGET